MTSDWCTDHVQTSNSNDFFPFPLSLSTTNNNTKQTSACRLHRHLRPQSHRNTPKPPLLSPPHPPIKPSPTSTPSFPAPPSSHPPARSTPSRPSPQANTPSSSHSSSPQPITDDTMDASATITTRPRVSPGSRSRWPGCCTISFLGGSTCWWSTR